MKPFICPLRDLLFIKILWVSMHTEAYQKSHQSSWVTYVFSPISSSLPSPINSMLVWINALQAVLAILKNDIKLIPPPRSHVRQGPHTELTLSILCHLHHELWYLVSLGLRFNISLQNPILYISPRCVTINHKMLWIPRAQSYHLTATGAWYS